jgi:hypothetical protein
MMTSKMNGGLQLAGMIKRLKSEINGVPVGVKAARRTENKSVLILADGLHPDLVIAALFESGQGRQF